MQLIQLPINGDQTRVRGTFVFAAALVGDAILSCAYTDARRLPAPTATYVPDAGDAAAPTIEALDLAILGVTGAGRVVCAFRSGNRDAAGGWDGTSSFYAAVGAASALRPASPGVVVQTTQPGPMGPMGPAGARGGTGPQGPAGANGRDATVTQETIDAIARAVATYPAAPDHFGIQPAEARSGLWMQDAVTALLSNQAVWQAAIRAIDEAAGNLIDAGYAPRVGGEG